VRPAGFNPVVRCREATQVGSTPMHPRHASLHRASEGTEILGLEYPTLRMTQEICGVKVPNAEQATVAMEKITRYVLNPTHRVGGPKSAFFLAFGFTIDPPAAR